MKKNTIILIFLITITSCSKNEEIVLKNTKPQIQKQIIKSANLISTWKIIQLNNSLSGKIETKTEDKTEIIIQEIKREYISLDDSITKFVNNKVHFSKLTYSPNDLVSLKWEYIIDTKWNQTLRKDANLYLQELAKDFYLNFKVKLKIVSAYRSYSYQKWIKDWWCPDNFCAKAGYSEHQSWLAIDFFETTTKEEFLAKKDLKKYFEWLSQNAHKYWFHNSYRNWKEIDWYAIEPWHWRYLWVEFATELKKENITYWEYYLIHWQK